MSQTRKSARSEAKSNKPGRYVNTLLHSHVYDALKQYAEDNGFSEPAVLRMAAAMLLRNAGYLQTDFFNNQKQKR